MNKLNKLKVTFTLDQDVVQALKEISQQEERSLSQQVNKILKEELERRAAQK